MFNVELGGTTGTTGFWTVEMQFVM